MRVCTWSYCVLLCTVRLISLGGLFFSEGKWRRSGCGGEVICEGNQERGGRGKSSLNVLCDRIRDKNERGRKGERDRGR